MKTDMALELLEGEDAESVQAAIRAGIRVADLPELGPRGYRPLTLALRAADGTLKGGLYGATAWGWLMIDGLWVARELRGRGFGRRLMSAAESEAVARGCRGAWLGTFDFQAREFYERLGYVVFAELRDFPEGHAHFHLRKSLAAPAPSPSPPSDTDGSSAP